MIHKPQNLESIYVVYDSISQSVSQLFTLSPLKTIGRTNFIFGTVVGLWGEIADYQNVTDYLELFIAGLSYNSYSFSCDSM